MKSLTCFCAFSLVPMAAFAQQGPIVPATPAPMVQVPAVPAAPLAQETGPKAIQAAKLDALLMNVQDQIEFDPELGGVMITDAVFLPKMNAPGEVLELHGKVMDPAQKPIVKQMVEQALSADPYWREGEGPLEVSAEMMEVSLGSLPLSNRYYALGLDYFWKKNYAQADRAFARALAEAPNDDVLRYWRVMSALAQGQEDRAKAKLRGLLVTYPLGSRTPIIATAFERLQGPLRVRLMQLENEILATL